MRATVVATEAQLRAEYENIQDKGYKYTQHGNYQKFKAINQILYSWCKKCEVLDLYVTGPFLKDEAMDIKSSLNQSVLEDVRASDGWLYKWELIHGIREKQISGASLGVPETKVKSWIERIKQLLMYWIWFSKHLKYGREWLFL